MIQRTYRPLGVVHGHAVQDAARQAAMNARLAGAAKSRTRGQSGKTAEALIIRTNEIYFREGVAKVIKQYPPVAGTPGHLVYSGKGAIDFMGALAPHGRLIAFDLKGITNRTTLEVPDVLPLVHKRHKASLRDRQRLIDQANDMLQLRVMGATVAFVCVDQQRERAWIMPEVERIARGESVPIRHRDQDLWPAVAFASLDAIVRGAPLIDYLSVWPGL